MQAQMVFVVVRSTLCSIVSEKLANTFRRIADEEKKEDEEGQEIQD